MKIVIKFFEIHSCQAVHKANNTSSKFISFNQRGIEKVCEVGYKFEIFSFFVLK